MSDLDAAKAIVHEPPAVGLWLGLDTGGTSYRYYLVWITRLAPGVPRTHVSEVTAR